MKKLFAALILSVGLTPAWAEWELITESATGNLELISPKTLQKSGNTVRVWTMREFSDVNAKYFKSSRALTEFNCHNKSFRHLQFSAFKGSNGQGGLIFTENRPEEIIFAEPGTVMDILLTEVCKRR
jgi:hypothetical protein